MCTIVKVKRKTSDEPPDCLIIKCKKKKLESVDESTDAKVAANEADLVKQVFRYMGSSENEVFLFFI